MNLICTIKTPNPKMHWLIMNKSEESLFALNKKNTLKPHFFSCLLLPGDF